MQIRQTNDKQFNDVTLPVLPRMASITIKLVLQRLSKAYSKTFIGMFLYEKVFSDLFLPTVITAVIRSSKYASLKFTPTAE